MTIVLDQIAAEIAALARLVPVPAEPFGYGVDLSCTDDITETLDEVDPFSVLAIAQAMYRRLTTPRGTLPDDPNYGLDIRGFLNRGTSVADLRDLAAQAKAEVTKDDRVADVTVTVTVPALNTLQIQLRATPADPSLGPFSMTLAVSSGEVLINALE